MERTDALGRRLRMRRQPKGKRIGLRPRDLLWFEKLHQHGPLPTSYLYEFGKLLGRDKSRTLKRLADLYNERGYLDRPLQQFQTIDARYNQLVYQLAPKGEAVLEQHGKWHDVLPLQVGLWTHRLMVSCVTASLELAVREHPNLSYIPQHAILEHGGADLRIPIAYENPATRKSEQGHLIPDALCGIAYEEGGTTRYRFFLIEADRNMEPNRSGQSARKSFQKNVLQYRELVGRARYKEHFKLHSPLVVLIVTTSRRHMRRMQDVVREIAPSGSNSFLCFQTVPEFATPFVPPQLLLHLLETPWERVGHEPLSLLYP